MKAPELEALADAVRSENYRLHALQAQARSVRCIPYHCTRLTKRDHRGLPPFLGTGDQSPPDFSRNKDGIDWDRVAQKVRCVALLLTLQ